MKAVEVSNASSRKAKLPQKALNRPSFSVGLSSYSSTRPVSPIARAPFVRSIPGPVSLLN